MKRKYEMEFSEHERNAVYTLKVTGFVLLLSLLFAFAFTDEAKAYQWLDDAPGDGAPTAGITSGTNWNSGTTIDCIDSGISEISRLDVWGDSTGAWTSSAYLDGERASVYNTYSNTATSTTMTGSTTVTRFQLSWSPAIWCAGRTVDLVLERLSGSPFYHSNPFDTSKSTIISSGSGSSYPFPFQRSWCVGSSLTSCTEVGQMSLNVFATDATSTASGGGDTVVSVTNDFTGLQIVFTVFASVFLFLAFLIFFINVLRK